MAKKSSQPSEPKKTSLLKPKSEAYAQIKEQIEKLTKLLAESDIEQARATLDKYADYNKELLGQIFDGDAISRQYRGAINNAWNIQHAGYTWGRNPEPEIKKFYRAVQEHINTFESICQKLELIPEITKVSNIEENNKLAKRVGSEVFIVHGHDNISKEKVAEFIRALGLNPIILHEQPNKGRAVIEKFEDCSDVVYAVVLLTPDDVGASAIDRNNLRNRARQNVIFELGFFFGKLSRERVCVLYKGDVELFSDYDGILFVPMDENDGWKLKLAKELEAAGIPIDLNKAI